LVKNIQTIIQKRRKKYELRREIYTMTEKKEVVIYDYVDLNVPVMARMYERRIKGYEIEDEQF
jgi:hypothetical protein